ncbi:hypothetical protein, partial [Ancylomarina sp.]|uniref:hypothetical protein n=1 Tax=Ancylomarina sp. TaxID=1970196 RepID=UPI003566FD88
SNESFDPGILLFIIISTSLIMSWGLIHSAIVQDIPLIINPIIEEEMLGDEELTHGAIGDDENDSSGE